MDWEYYEAFCIEARTGRAKKNRDYRQDNGIVAPLSDQGTDQISRGPHGDSWGSWKVETQAYWLPEQPTGMTASNVHLLRYVEDLPASGVAPLQLAGVGWMLSQEVESSWNRCEGEREGHAPSHLSGTATAKNLWGTYDETWTVGSAQWVKKVDGRRVG